MPINVRNLTNCSVETFKNALDNFLSSVNDQPLLPGYIGGNNHLYGSNSLIDVLSWEVHIYNTIIHCWKYSYSSFNSYVIFKCIFMILQSQRRTKMNQLSEQIFMIFVVLIHLSTQQIHYPHFPSFYTFTQYPILNGYFASGRGSGFFHRYDNKSTFMFTIKYLNLIVFEKQSQDL